MNTTRDLLKIGLVANLFEWYEFGIYGYLAGIVSQIFFSPGDSISSLIQGFAVFCHRLSCKTAREHFLWFCRRLGGTRPRAENIAHHDGSANGTDWLLANL